MCQAFHRIKNLRVVLVRDALAELHGQTCLSEISLGWGGSTGAQSAKQLSFAICYCVIFLCSGFRLLMLSTPSHGHLCSLPSLCFYLIGQSSFAQNCWIALQNSLGNAQPEGTSFQAHCLLTFIKLPMKCLHSC